MDEPHARSLKPRDAADWLLDLFRTRNNGRNDPPPGEKRAINTVPEASVLHDDHNARMFGGRRQYSGPPPLNHTEIILPDGSKTARQIEQARKAFLESLGVPVPSEDHVDLAAALHNFLWRPAAAPALTAGFKGKSHDESLRLLRERADAELVGRPRITILQSLQDAGCDLLIDWGDGLKFGIQLKSHFDIGQKSFASNTTGQIQYSRQHGLELLYILLAGDLTDPSQEQKVRGFEAAVSKQNDRYAVTVSPERVWTLLFPSG
jgi:hypothetical protein